MADTLTRAQEMLDERRRELTDELKRVEDALRSLSDTDGGRQLGRRRATTRRRPGAATKRAPRGQRQEQLLAAIRESPGTAVSELAEKIGVARPHAHSIARRLRDQGMIRKRGRGFVAD